MTAAPPRPEIRAEDAHPPSEPSQAEKLAQLARVGIRRSTAAWFETFARIRDKAGALIRPRPNYLQAKIAAVIERMETDALPVRLIALKPRARGSSTYFAAEGYARLRRASASGVVIGGEFSQTDCVWKMWQIYQANDMFDGWANTGVINEREGKWSHGSTLKKETAGDVHAGIGGSYQVLHVTELGRWPNEGQAAAGDVLANVLKCVGLLPGTMVAMESTAEGETSEFASRWWQACPAEDYLSGKKRLRPGDYVAIFAPWFAFADSAQHLTSEEKQEIEATLDRDEMFGPGEEKRLIELYGRKGEDGILRLGTSATGFDVWEQLAWRRQEIVTNCKRDWRVFDRDHPHSPAAAFTASGKNVFLPAQLDRVEAASRQLAGAARFGCLDRTQANGSKPRMVFRATPEHEAWCIIFEAPRVGCRYLVVADPATGAERASGEDPDRHSALVIRAGQMAVGIGAGWQPAALVARVKPPCDAPIDVLADWMDRLSWHYGRCLVAFEINNSGLALYEALKALPSGCPPLYYRDVNPFRRDSSTQQKKVGWDTTEPTRRLLVETLQRAIRELGTDGEGVLVPSKHTMAELRKFVVIRGKAQAARGSHDDDGFALAIGLCLQGSATVCAMEVVQRQKQPWELQKEWQQQQERLELRQQQRGLPQYR